MRANIQDRDALLAISPTALVAYARDLGWSKVEPYGDHSDVYFADGVPEIILPRTQRLGDYGSVIAQLLKTFADVTDRDELSVYQDLIIADRDVVRVRAPGGYDDGTIGINSGLDLLNGSSRMLLAAACSLSDPRPLYRTGAVREATDYLSRVSLGQTEQGSFVITLLSPAIAPPLQARLSGEHEPEDDPFERRVTRRLAEALAAVRNATERTTAGDMDAFPKAVKGGVSANLCEALVTMINPFPELDVSIAWARTYPRDTKRIVVPFAPGDVPILREAARVFRAREPKPDERLFGKVWKLTRDDKETKGTITMRGSVDDRVRSIIVVLNQSDYDRAIHAHQDKLPIIIDGDLERSGQRWQLLSPRIVKVIEDGDDPEEAD